MKMQSGVTLIELVFSLSVLCLLSAFAYPEIQKYSSQSSYNDEITKLVAALHKGRKVAIQRNTYVVLQYSAMGYTMFIDNGAGGGEKGDGLRQPGEELLIDALLLGGYRISPPESTFKENRARFHWGSGVASGSIVMSANSGQKSKVCVNCIGKVSVEKL